MKRDGRIEGPEAKSSVGWGPGTEPIVGAIWGSPTS